MSELTPFGGPGDPLEDDFTGELLVNNSRPEVPYDEEAKKALEIVEEEMRENQDQTDLFSRLIAKYGE